MKTITVLITDDSKVNRTTLKQFLKREAAKKANADYQFEITEAEDGNIAVERVTQRLADLGKPFDIIIMDYEMPKMDGSSATHAIRNIEKDYKKLEKKSFIASCTTVTNKNGGLFLYPEADISLPKNPINAQTISLLFEAYFRTQPVFQRDQLHNATPTLFTPNKRKLPRSPSAELRMKIEELKLTSEPENEDKKKQSP